MDRHYFKLCEMITKQFKCREHRSKYSFYSIKKRGLYCDFCIGELIYSGSDLIKIISENNFLSAICYLANYTKCEAHNQYFEFYCKHCSEFHCNKCLKNYCVSYLIVLNEKIVALENYEKFIYNENTIKSRKLSTFPLDSLEYFEFFKFQLKKYKNKEDINLFFNKTMDFNNDRIVMNKNNYNITDISDDAIEQDFNVLNKLSKKSNKTSKSNSNIISKENLDKEKESQVKNLVNLGVSNLSSSIIKVNDIFKKNNELNSESCSVDKSCKNPFDIIFNNKFQKAEIEIYDLNTHKNISEEKTNINKKKNGIENTFSMDKRIESSNFLINNCFTFSFYINNKLKKINFSLDFNKKNDHFSDRIKAIESVINTKKLHKKYIDSQIKNYVFFEKYAGIKNIFMINKLENFYKDNLYKNLDILIRDQNKVIETEKSAFIIGQYPENDNFQLIYNPNTYEIKIINFESSDQDYTTVFSFLTLDKIIIEETVDIILTQKFVGKNNYFEIKKSSDENLKTKYSNPKLLFSYIEIFGTTSDNSIIGVIRNKAFFTINLENKEIEVFDMWNLEDVESLVFFNQINQKNPKIEIDLPDGKKFFYFLIEENYSDKLKFFTYNISKKEIKLEYFNLDEKLPRIYFTNILNELLNCFFVNISKENYEKYSQSKEGEEKNENYFFLVFILENKIVKLKFNIEKLVLEFFSEKLIRNDKMKNFRARNFYSNVKNYEYYVLFLNEDFQIILYNFFNDEFKILKEFL